MRGKCKDIAGRSTCIPALSKEWKSLVFNVFCVHVVMYECVGRRMRRRMRMRWKGMFDFEVDGFLRLPNLLNGCF